MASAGVDHLSKLPEEILELVADHCEEHVLSLRRTCREIQHKSWHSFTRRFFSTRHIWMDDGSLSTLKQISSDSQYAACVKQLFVHFHEWKEQHILAHFSDHDGFHEISPIRDDKNAEYAYAQFNEQQYLLQSGEASLLLTSIMSNLPNLELVNLAADHVKGEYWPYSHFKDCTPDRYDGLVCDGSDSVEFNSKVVLSVIQAVVKAQPALKELCAYQPLPWQAITSLTPSVISKLAKPLSTLDALTLQVEIPKVHPRGKFWQDSFAAFLCQCPLVSKLDIGFEAIYDEERAGVVPTSKPIMRDIAAWPTFPKLKELHLERMSIVSTAFVEFLERHLITIERLHLESITFENKPASWRAVLEGFASGAALRDLCLSIGFHQIILAHNHAQIMKDVAEVLKNGLAFGQRLHHCTTEDSEYDEEDHEYSGDEDFYESELETHYLAPWEHLPLPLIVGGPINYDTDGSF